MPLALLTKLQAADGAQVELVKHCTAGYNTSVEWHLTVAFQQACWGSQLLCHSAQQSLLQWSHALYSCQAGWLCAGAAVCC